MRKIWIHGEDSLHVSEGSYNDLVIYSRVYLSVDGTTLFSGIWSCTIIKHILQIEYDGLWGNKKDPHFKVTILLITTFSFP